MSFGCLAQKKKTSVAHVPQTQEDSVKFEAILVEAEKQLILENYAEALENFYVALKMNDQSAAVNFKISEVLSKNKQGQRAIPYARKATELNPGNKYYWLFLARVYQSVGFFIDAVKTYRTLLSQYPSEESALYELAELYQNLGRIDEMFDIFDLIESQIGLKVELVRERQRILMQKGNINGVITEYQKLINVYPNETAYRIEFINFLLQNKRLDLAEREIKEYEETEQASSRMLLLKSELSWLKGERTEAFNLLSEAFETVTIDFETKFQILSNYLSLTNKQNEVEKLTEISIELAQQYPDEYKVQAFAGDLLYQSGQKEQALAFYLRAVDISPVNYSVWQNIISIEAELNDYENVIKHAEQALEYFPNQAGLYYFACTGYLIQKEYKKSVRICDQGRKYTIDPDLLSVFYGQLGDAYNGLGEHEKSDDSYEKALQNKPANDHVLNNYSYFLSLRKKDLNKALKMSSVLVRQHPDNPTYLDTHGWVLYISGNYKESRKYLEKASSLEDDGTIIEHFGDVLFKLGDIKGALEQWERARNLGEASENIDKKIAERKLYE